MQNTGNEGNIVPIYNENGEQVATTDYTGKALMLAVQINSGEYLICRRKGGRYIVQKTKPRSFYRYLVSVELAVIVALVGFYTCLIIYLWRN